MGTRAIYTFKDEQRTIHVYKHCDGYPTGGLYAINAATTHAWTLPRFEADEFAAAFVSANKDGEGDIRLIGKEEPHEFASDTEYLYEITQRKGALHVRIFYSNEGKRGRCICSQPLDKAIEKYRKKEEEEGL